MQHGGLTAATLPEAEIAPTVRLDCRRAFLNIVTQVCVSREEEEINCTRNWRRGDSCGDDNEVVAL